MITVITPTWDLPHALEQITERRKITKADHMDVVVWSGAVTEELSEDDDQQPEERGYVVGPTITQIEEVPLDNCTVIASRKHLPPVEAMWVGAEIAMRRNPLALLMFLHDDVDILQPGWDTVVENFFTKRPLCGLAGFGGALGLGTNDIYQTPYALQQLVRISYSSAADDYYLHGALLHEPLKVAVLDGLCLIVRPAAYVEIGGWMPCIRDSRIPFHMYDAWLSLMMARTHKWQVWALPVRFHHHGGGTSVKYGAEYESMVKRLGFASGQELYESAHRSIYAQFQDVLPLRV